MGKKKIFILGFIIVLLAAIPATIWIIGQRTNVQQHAAPSTTLSFNPASSSVQPGQTFTTQININPGQNSVSFVKLDISYDSTKLATAAAGITNNQKSFPQILEGPFYGPCNGNFCSISYTVGIGADPTQAVTAATWVAQIAFTAIAPTDPSTPTQVTFGTNTKVLSIASSDQASENVLLNQNPMSVTIGGSGSGGSPTPSPSGVATPTPTPPTGTTPTPTPPTGGTTTTPTPSGTTGQLPVCTSLSVDQNAAPPPATIMFTANGNTPVSGNTLTAVTFNFGDGTTQQVTSGGGIGTNSVSAQLAHTYNTPGTYTASATVTDSTGAVSTSNCSQTVTISSNSATLTQAPQQPTVMPTISLISLPKTGPGDTFVILGTAGGILTIIGGFLFFML